MALIRTNNMMKLTIPNLIGCFLALAFLSSCTKDIQTIAYNPEIAVPLFSSSTTIQDLFGENTDTAELVVIDGSADLIVGYNNEESAGKIVNDIMKWTAELNIHIITIVHQNKGDNNAKGHLGSIILQKAETVLSVEKDRDISNVTPSHSRDIDINPISFSVDENGLPYFVDFNPNSNNFNKKIRQPRDINEDVHKTILNEVFIDKTELLSSDFQRFLKDVLAKHNIVIGNTAIRDWKTFYETSKMITKENQQAPFKLSGKLKLVS